MRYIIDSIIMWSDRIEWKIIVCWVMSFEIDELLEVYSVGYCIIVGLVIWFVEGYLM